MDLNSLPIMAALKERMSWLTQNQRVISENVANADTPGYRAHRLNEQSFGSLVEHLNGSAGNDSPVAGPRGPQGPNRPGLGHASGAKAETSEDEEAPLSPTGNSVVLEEEMLRLADTQLEYGLVVEVYKKNKALLAAAMGRRGI